MLLLESPNDDKLDHAYAALKKLHADAFGWNPPDVAGLERLGATRMRQYVRAWINEWDLTRLDRRSGQRAWRSRLPVTTVRTATSEAAPGKRAPDRRLAISVNGGISPQRLLIFTSGRVGQITPRVLTWLSLFAGIC